MPWGAPKYWLCCSLAHAGGTTARALAAAGASITHVCQQFLTEGMLTGAKATNDDLQRYFTRIVPRMRAVSQLPNFLSSGYAYHLHHFRRASAVVMSELGCGAAGTCKCVVNAFNGGLLSECSCGRACVWRRVRACMRVTVHRPVFWSGHTSAGCGPSGQSRGAHHT
jgi:hypothetical protein